MSLTGIATIPKQTFSQNETNSIQIDVKVMNPLNQDVKVIQYLSYLSYVQSVDFNGSPLQKINTGKCIKSRPPRDSDYILLSSGKDLDFKISLSYPSYYYDLSQKGTYVVTLNNNVNGRIDDKDTTFQFIVNKIQFSIQ